MEREAVVRAREKGRQGKDEGGRKVTNGMKGGESACERPRVKRGKTKGVVENCESRGSIVTPFAGLASRGGSDATTTVTITTTSANDYRTATAAQPRYHRHPPPPPVLAPIPRGYLVLLPSSGLSIESTDVVNYSLIR